MAADPGYGLRSSRLVGKSETMGLSVGAREYYANKEEIQLINRYGVLPHCPCCATACLPLSRVLPLVGEVPHSPGPAPFPTLLCSRTHPPGRACGTRACASETTTLVLFAALPKSSQPVLPGPLHPAPPFAYTFLRPPGAAATPAPALSVLTPPPPPPLPPRPPPPAPRPPPNPNNTSPSYPLPSPTRSTISPAIPVQPTQKPKGADQQQPCR